MLRFIFRPLLAVFLFASFPAFASSAPAAQPREVLEIQRLMHQGQWPQALEKTERLIAAKPREAQGRFLKGLILTETNHPAEAIAVFTRLTEDFPELPEPYNNLAVLYAQQKQYDRARSALEMAIRTHPSYATAHENLGDIYAALASQAYGKALQLDARNTVMQTKLSMIRDLMSASASKTRQPALAQTTASAVGAAEPPEPSPPAPPRDAASSAKPPAPAEPPVPPSPKETPSANGSAAAGKLVSSQSAADKPKPPPAGQPSQAENELAQTARAWAAAWSKKDVKTYLSHYAPDFQLPDGMTRKAWEAERTRRIDKPEAIKVTLEAIRVSIVEEKATVQFRQRYVSGAIKNVTQKTLTLTRAGKRWLIQQERVH